MIHYFDIKLFNVVKMGAITVPKLFTLILMK